MPTRKVLNSSSEIKFLDGPQSRWSDFKFTLKVVREFLKGFRVLHFSGPCVTIFGSARFEEDHPYYQKTVELAGKIAQLGFTIMTGGGPGIMEAANRGAKEVGGRSVGCNIELPFEQEGNPYLDKWVTIKYFFVRKTLMMKYSYAFVVMPGGFGTLDELFEALTLVQTGKIKDFPIIIFGTEWHEKLMEYVHNLKDFKTISPEDIDLILFTDSMDEVVDACKSLVDKFKLEYEKRPKYFPFLGENKSK
jgi:uncharacterized protein (TIGR00730 family)